MCGDEELSIWLYRDYINVVKITSLNPENENHFNYLPVYYKQ